MTRPFLPVLLLLLAATLTSCGGSLFKVKPAAELPPLPENSRSAEAGDLTVRVAPSLTDEESQELFEANLPLAGILPLRLELVLHSGGPVEIRKVRFRLRDGQNREWKLLSSKKAISQIMKTNGIRLYNPNSRRRFEQEFGEYGIDSKTPLTPGDPRQGFLFFQSPDKKAVTAGQQFELTVERLPQTASIAVPVF